MDKGKVFVDTSGFKALIDGMDEFHTRAEAAMSRLQSEGILLVTTNYILDETFTLVRARCGRSVVKEFRTMLLGSVKALHIVRVTVADEAASWRWFDSNWGKLSYTDCTSWAVMKRLDIDRALSFDKQFARAGFALET